MNLPREKIVIGIVGGRGEMGRAFADFFRRQGFREEQILISGRNPDGKKILSNAELVQRADVVIVSVPLAESVRVIEELAPLLNSEQLFLDVSSIKTPQVAAMLKSKAEVLGTHPMFGGNISFVGQVVVVCPARVKRWKNWFEDLLKKEGVKIVTLSPEEHDRRVPLVQALPHFLALTFAETLTRSNEKISAIHELATPNAKLLLDFVARIVNQPPRLTLEIQRLNPASKLIREQFTDAITEWQAVCADEDPANFLDRHANLKNFLADFLSEGLEESQLFLNTIAWRTSKIEEFEQSYGKPRGENQKPAAVFGGKNSNTHKAAKRFFSKVERRGDFLKFFMSIKSVFEAVKTGVARWGIVPLENETGGIIRETFDQLLESKGDIKIRNLISVKITHVLAVNRDADQNAIKTIYSHQQALSQCQENILKRFPNAKQIPTASTTEALEKVAKLKNAAAIGSEEAVKELGLEIIDPNFGDREQNATTFAVIAKNWSRLDSGHALVAFNFRENKPGQLADVLDIFRDAGVNMSKIISIPTGPESFSFFVELEHSKGLKKALKEAGKKSDTLFSFSNYKKL